MEKYQEIADVAYSKLAELRNECIKWLTEWLENHDGIVTIDIEDLDEVPYISYDGGNHPEYKYNPMSEVKNIYLKDGKINVEIEETDDYDVTRITTDDLFEICEFVNNCI